MTTGSEEKLLKEVQVLKWTCVGLIVVTLAILLYAMVTISRVTVDVYGKPGCVQCKYTNKKLEEDGHEVRYHDIMEDQGARQVVEQSGQLALPLVVAGDKSKAADLFKLAQSVIDSVADKGIFHKNKAARDKSRLSSKVKALALAAA